MLFPISLAYLFSSTTIVLPNPLPVLFARFGDRLPLTVYHILLFGVGFALLVLSYSLIGGSGRIGYRFLALYGVLLIGLVYQDWFWFIAAPYSGLVCGGVYGVYFKWWIRVASLCLPGMYLVSATVGLILFAYFARKILRKRFLASLAGLLLAMILLYCLGVIIQYLKTVYRV